MLGISHGLEVVAENVSQELRFLVRLQDHNKEA